MVDGQVPWAVRTPASEYRWCGRMTGLAEVGGDESHEAMGVPYYTDDAAVLQAPFGDVEQV